MTAAGTGTPPQAVCTGKGAEGDPPKPWSSSLPRPGGGHSHGSDTAGPHREQAGAWAQRGSRDPRSHLQEAGGRGKEGARSY